MSRTLRVHSGGGTLTSLRRSPATVGIATLSIERIYGTVAGCTIYFDPCTSRRFCCSDALHSISVSGTIQPRLRFPLPGTQQWPLIQRLRLLRSSACFGSIFGMS